MSLTMQCATFSPVFYKTEMTEIILQERILLSLLQCALAVPTQ